MAKQMLVNGYQSIAETVKIHPERILKIIFPQGKLSLRQEELQQLAKKNRVQIEFSNRQHQSKSHFKHNDQNDYDDRAEDSVQALLKEYIYNEYADELELLKEKIAIRKKTEPFPSVLVLDQITDAHNLGAVLRTAAVIGIDLIILPRDRSASINEGAYKVASGGLDHLKIVQVTNLVQVLRDLKELGFWTVGFSEHAEKSLGELKNDFASVLVIGNEETGMRKLVSENCDYLVKINGLGGLHSLNASIAASLAMAWAKGSLAHPEVS